MKWPVSSSYSGPHLHFVVQRNVGLALESIPFNFAQPVDSLPTSPSAASEQRQAAGCRLG
ncbi:hypothetical protein HNE05_18605 [Aquipseudomonas campi]|uniref:Uncharacterized protein n=1 Tax=Aquipseudomonas campi TaxID=2731681 RepID=A0A6M8F3V1_9GAMM|nr:hypothetical protein HNE05_18605 [Pseudomonas campi]